MDIEWYRFTFIGEILFEGTPFNKLTHEELAMSAGKDRADFQNFNLIPSWTALEKC